MIPAIQAELKRVSTDLKESKTTFMNQTIRLARVRELKLIKLNAVDDDMNADIDIMSDTQSMATTRITGFSSQSRTSTNFSSKTG